VGDIAGFWKPITGNVGRRAYEDSDGKGGQEGKGPTSGRNRRMCCRGDAKGMERRRTERPECSEVSAAEMKASW
jgi:hypothetical protein